MMMIPRHLLFFSVIISMQWPAYACFKQHARAIETLTRQILRENSKTLPKQLRLIRALHLCPDLRGIRRESLSKIITALAHHKKLAMISNHHDILQQSAHYFFTTPGCLHVIKRALEGAHPRNQSLFRGSYYELEKALDILRTEHEPILAFNTTVASDTLGIQREIDIITPRRWIECKNISHLTEHRKVVLKRQILGQYLIAQDEHIEYQVCFKHEIPPDILAWLHEQSIAHSQDKPFSRP